MKYVDLDGKAYTYQVSENEFWFASDICVLDKFFSDLSGLIPGSALAKRLSDATTDLNRIEGTSTADVIRCTGSDVILEVMNKSDSSILKSVGYITLDIDKKGILKSYRINNQLAIDMLYCELRNLQLKLNIGSTNE